LPEPVQAILATVRIRIKAEMLAITSVSIDPTGLVIRGAPSAPYDRAALYTRYGMAARVDRGVVRVPATRLSAQRADDVEGILDGALALARRGGGLAGTPGEAGSTVREPASRR
jgi:hypothetical protein